MKTLRHHESKLIRPFLGWDDCQRLLSGSAIRLRSSEVPTKEDSVIVRIEDVASLEPAVFANLEQSSLAAALSSVRLAPKDVEFNIIVSFPGLKKSVVAYQCGVSEIPVAPIPVLDDEVKELFKSQGGIDLTLALTLAKELNPEPLRPFFFGEWIAKKTFALRPEAPTSDFSLARLTDDKRKEFGLPKGTTYWVQMLGGSLNDAEANLREVVTIWVDESVLDHLARSTASPSSLGFQKLMLADVVSSIVFEALSDPTEEVVPKSPLDGVLEDLSKSCGIKKKELETLSRTNQHKVRTYVQHMLEVSSSICSAT